MPKQPPAAKSKPKSRATKANTLTLDGLALTLDTVAAFLVDPSAQVSLAPDALERVDRARELVERLTRRPGAVYGVNTGFGKLANTRIDAGKLGELQINLIRSHSCGVGDPLPAQTVRLAMLLRLNSLLRGHSGVTRATVKTYADMLNHGLTPVVPSRGSVGASGDLAPLSHVALAALGEGEVLVGGQRVPSGPALKKAGITPLKLGAKEGLALINGTQFIQAIGLTALTEARRMVKLADVAAALSLEALRGTDRAFDARIAELRPHPGHAAAAANLRDLLKGSQIRASHLENDTRVQDAYSLRCVPQVHGAVRDTLDFVSTVFTRELNSVTDNPLLFPNDGEVISGGNFHGEPVAFACDFLAIAIAELGSISERRIESMVNPDLSMLPPFLTKDPGLNSGLMIAQVTAAALVSENKTLCHPASVDSIPTSANKEDHVSMGVWGAIKLGMVVANVRRVLEIELLCARLGVAHHAPLKTSKQLAPVFDALCSVTAPMGQDRVLYRDFEAIRAMIDGGAFERTLASLK